MAGSSREIDKTDFGKGRRIASEKIVASAWAAASSAVDAEEV